MANTQSAIKRVRQEKKRHLRNRIAKSRMRTAVRAANEALASNTTESAETVLTALSQIDKAAQKGVIHPKQAARRKSRMMKRANQAG